MSVCDHEWISGPFYIGVWIDPYADLHAYLQVDHCKLCGVIRLPESHRAMKGAYAQDQLRRKG